MGCMKYKVSELEGPMLDAAVAKVEGFGADRVRIVEAGAGDECQVLSDHGGWLPRWYSSLWNDGGGIIERERITVDAQGGGGRTWWRAWPQRTGKRARPSHHYGNGSTPLIAAMRAYVGSELGEYVELP